MDRIQALLQHKLMRELERDTTDPDIRFYQIGVCRGLHEALEILKQEDR